MRLVLQVSLAAILLTPVPLRLDSSPPAQSSKPPSGIIQGGVLMYDRDLRTNLHARERVSGAEVTLQGKDVLRRVVTGPSGVFSFRDLPAEEFTVTCRLPRPTLIPANASSRNIDLRRNNTAFFTFTAYNDGGIRGRIAGLPQTITGGFRVDLVLASPEFPDFPQALYANTDPGGRFEFDRIPPGRYLLGIRMDGNREADFPYPRTYYPGVSDPAKATVIELNEGQWLDLPDMRAPTRLVERFAEGRVIDKDGNAPSDASVTLDLAEYPYASPGGTVAATAGTFTMKMFEGLRYRLRAVGVLAGNSTLMRATPVDIPREGAVSGITLVLSTSVRTLNLLQNPDARGGGSGWKFQGEGGAELTGPGPCFFVRNGGTAMQDVVLPQGSVGRYLLVFGRLASERINPDGRITGLPGLSGYLLMPTGGEITLNLQGQQLSYRGRVPNAWGPAYGFFQIVPKSGRIRLMLHQAEAAGLPQNGSAARFRNLGLYLFDSRPEAELFLNHSLLSRSNGNPDEPGTSRK